ncbi:chromosome segregation protein SMC [Rhizobiales bacterium]|uniref:chromosome segregation SMC family protein n=1 Tax=Hongsoonwoonella zoysiae TaxID=2821844 RepID=UPI00156067B1|nr:chromosome segregation SMC family protein [Hongsoonwoonella zoysiae]NRG19766.1 chromosome segregation protein SMC [Hongsoonwoonella zoysiae]
MKFNKLRVLGFKSFVEPMEFVIGAGLTGVVGPNGCGKSNLVEALRWVMGENSYKNMRASGMDDVIFSGSLNRPARNTAEVTLFLDNGGRTAPSGFNDADLLEVTRRIERESGSAYKINGKDVRARDVQLLFADASTGARSPALVRQGQIGELIAAKPTSRRMILEEAAGISGLHSRRHEAELRLKAAEQNLERLEDVLVQIDQQLDGLKRQARQASRYRNLSSEIRQTEATLLYLRWLEGKAQLEAAEAEAQSAAQEMATATATQAEAAKHQAIAQHKMPELRDAAAKAGAVLQRLIIARNELDSEERRVREKLSDLSARLQQLAGDIEREERMIAENGEHLELLTQEEEELRLENEAEAERAEEARTRVEAATERVSALETKLGELTQEQARVDARRRELERLVQDAKARADRLSRQMAETEEELTTVTQKIADEEGPAMRREELELAEAELVAGEEAVAEAEETTRNAREALEAARAPLSDAEGKLSRLETEAATLAKVLNVEAPGDWEPVVEAIKVAPGFEAALGAALGEDLDAPVDDRASVHWAGFGDMAGDPALPEGAVPLSHEVDAPAALHRRLAQIGIVDADRGRVLQKLLKPGQRLVSRDGDLWRWDGFTIAADAPTPAAQRLQQKNRLAALEDEIETARSEVEARQEALQAAFDAVRRAGDYEQASRGRLKESQRKAMFAREALAEAERALTQLSSRQETLRDTVQRLEGEIAEARERMLDAESDAADLPEVSGLAEAITDLRTTLADARAQLAEARAGAEGLARERQMRDRRLEAIARERANWANRVANAQSQIEVLRGRREEAEEERQTLAEAPEDIDLKRRELLNRISTAEEERKKADDTLVSAEAQLAELDRGAKATLEALSGARERKIRTEERLEAARARKAEIEERIDEALEVPVSALPELAGLKEGAPLPQHEAMERKLERLKGERERLGGVNLRAEEEMREIDEQRTTLGRERDDLIEAIKRLRNGISNLNREARERLLKAFAQVNDHFQRLFAHLFGGGTAELQLVDADDPLEAGLEIIARPPGKKPQTMTLLSGGEQALTAMALIFAVFLTNPAPICVLDEVDAPLDDANVERYCDLLDEMTRNTDTRFVVITHNPITMARMNRLFGVTMAERGVSQLVSVDLETAESFLEAV